MVLGSKNDDGVIAEINVTPLVDITLVLLIILMVTARIIATPAVPLDLPRASKTEEVQVVFSIILAADGATLIDGVAASDEASLLEQARAARAKDAGLRAVINADGAVPHRRVLRVLDLLKVAGITRIAFGADPEQQQEAR